MTGLPNFNSDSPNQTPIKPEKILGHAALPDKCPESPVGIEN
jgi:hypothetical protein